MDFWVILGFVGAFLAGIGAYLGFQWAVKREAFRLYQKGKSLQATEKRTVSTNETLALMGSLKETLSAEGTFKEKMPKIMSALAENPNGAEALLNKLKGFL